MKTPLECKSGPSGRLADSKRKQITVADFEQTARDLGFTEAYGSGVALIYEGDVELDGDLAFLSDLPDGVDGVIIKGNLVLGGSLINDNEGRNMGLCVTGDVRAESLISHGNGFTLIRGDLFIEHYVYGEYNDGAVYVDGKTYAPYVFNSDHCLSLGIADDTEETDVFNRDLELAEVLKPECFNGDEEFDIGLCAALIRAGKSPFKGEEPRQARYATPPEHLQACGDAIATLDVNDQADEASDQQGEASDQADEASYQADEASDQAERDGAKAIIDRGEDLVAAAWASLDKPKLVRALFDHLAKEDPSMALTMARLRFIEEKGYDRDGCRFDFEAEEIYQELRDARIAPLLLAEDDPQLLQMLPELRDARLLEAVLPWLDCDDERCDRAIDVVHRADAREHEAKLCALLAQQLKGGDADRVRLLCRPVGDWGLRSAIPILVELASLLDRCWLPIGLALAKLDASEALTLLEPRLDTEEEAEALYALSWMPKNDCALELLTARAELLAGPSHLHVYERLLVERARHRRGIGADRAVALAGLGVVGAKPLVDSWQRRVAIELLGNDPAVRPSLDSPHASVRAAARLALGVETVAYDQAHAIGLYARGGARALAAALANPNGILKYNLIRRAASEGCLDEMVGEAAAWVRSQTDALPHFGGDSYPSFVYDPLKHALRALLAVQGEQTDRLFIELLGHSNSMIQRVVDELLRYTRVAVSPAITEAVSLPKCAEHLPTLVATELGAGAPWSTPSGQRTLAFHPDGARLAVLGRVGSAIYDENGRPTVTLPAGGTDVTYAPDGSAMAVSYGGDLVRLFDGRSGALLRTISGHHAGVNCVAFSPDGRWLAAGADNGLFGLWDWREGTLVAYRSEKERILVLAWTPNGRGVALCTADSLVLLEVGDAIDAYDAGHGSQELGKQSRIAKKLKGGGVALQTSLDGTRFYVGGEEGVQLFDVGTTLKKAGVLALPSPSSLRLTPDGKTLFAACGGSSGAEGGLFTVDLASGEARRLPGPASPSAVAYCAKTDSIAAGGSDRSIYRWDASRRCLTTPILTHSSGVTALATNGDSLYSAAVYNDLLVWSLESALATRAIPFGAKRRVACLALSADGRTLYAGAPDCVVACDLESGSERWRVEGLDCRCLIARGSKLLATDFWRLVVLDQDTGATLVEGDRLKTTLMHLALVGDRLLADDSDGKLWELDPDTGMLRRELPLPFRERMGRLWGASPDGRWLYVGTRRLDAETLAVRKHLRGTVDKAVLSPSGELLGMTSGNEIFVLDAETFAVRETARLPDSVSTLAFIDERRLVCGSGSGGVWRCEPR